MNIFGNLPLWIRISVGFIFLASMGVLALLAEHLFPWSTEITVAILVVIAFGLVVMTKHALEPLSRVTQVLEGIADGDLNQRAVKSERTDEIGSVCTSTNRMLSQLNALSERARQLADGKIDVLEVEEKVLRTERLADADQRSSGRDGDLERSFTAVTNQLRRLTIQARMISKDQLGSPLLDEKIPGELGEAFGLMVKKLRTITDRAKDIADGDLTSTVEGDGELATAFNQMVRGIRGLVEQITQTAIHISTAAEQILAVLREQEMAANHQASSVEETQRTMETLLSSAKKISDNAQHVFKSAEKTQHNNRTIAERISELKNHTERISAILEGIKRIADRSDLLALNASLEGMRAGEAGKGFTLVAAEMRRLAENIKDSVGDIKELVGDIGESSVASAMATDEGTRLSENTTDNALKITLITQQQKSGTEQVTQSMDDLSELINQDVAGTQQVTMAASELADLADSLRGLVDEFRISESPATSGEYKVARPRKRRTSSSFRAAPKKSSGRHSPASSPIDRSSEIRSRQSATDLSESSSPQHENAAAKPTERSERETTRLSAVEKKQASVERKQGSVEEKQVAGEKPASIERAKDEAGLDDESSIPIDSGADQPTIEFATNMSEDDQRDVMRKMLAEHRSASDDESGESDDPDTSDLEFEDGADVEAEMLGDDGSSVEDQIDALERELEKAGEGLEATSESETEP
jgi:methyl-accepting chemotaxis protein